MKETLIGILADYVLEEGKITEEERSYLHEALGYVKPEHKDDLEVAINCYAGSCERAAFKKGFTTAVKLIFETLGSNT